MSAENCLCQNRRLLTHPCGLLFPDQLPPTLATDLTTTRVHPSPTRGTFPRTRIHRQSQSGRPAPAGALFSHNRTKTCHSNKADPAQVAHPRRKGGGLPFQHDSHNV